jgi:hypothetical protein
LVTIRAENPGRLTPCESTRALGTANEKSCRHSIFERFLQPPPLFVQRRYSMKAAARQQEPESTSSVLASGWDEVVASGMMENDGIYCRFDCTD